MSETLAEPAVEPVEPVASEPAEPAEPAEPVAAEPVEPAAVTPEINWNDIDTLRAAAEHLQGLGYTIGQAPEPAAPEAPVFVDEYGNVDPNAVQSYIEQQIRSHTAPIEQYAAAQQAERVEGQIGYLLSEVASSHSLGEVDTARLRAIADSFAPDAARQHGNTPAAARYAAEKAAEWLVADRKAAGDAAVEAYKTGLSADGSHLLDPSVRGAGVAAGREFSDELDVARNYRFA